MIIYSCRSYFNRYQGFSKPGYIIRTELGVEHIQIKAAKVGCKINGVFKCKWEASNTNNACNLNVLDDMFHFLYESPHYNSLLISIFKITM